MKKFLVIILCGNLINSYAQENYCKFDIVNDLYQTKVNQQLSFNQNKRATIIIPVVFHIVYNASIENLHDTLIIKQLNKLNNDFKRLNADTINTPAPFKSLTTGMDIQFCFASTTPSLTPTNGINRVFTNKTFFNAPPNYIILDSLKHSNLGGADAWNTAKYLNIWAGNIINLSGYAAPPSNMMISEDGVGVNYKTLGTTNSTPPYNQGRTITHEVAHFFGLKHIWGDDGGTCAGTDFMGDTPNQANWTLGNMTNTCNVFPLVDACTPSGNGIMFMNYMDYCNDNCRNMFTTAQVNYMGATIACCRTGFTTTTLTDCYIATKLEENNSNGLNFLLYPNPTKEKLFIKSHSEINNITIKNILGEEVMHFEKSFEINVSNLAKGLYFIYINGLHEQKFVKE